MEWFMYGKTVDLNNRISDYKNGWHDRQPKLYNATQKYGWNNFTIEVIEKCTLENLTEREKYWIRHLNTFDISNSKMGYNMTPGGDGFCGPNHPLFGKKRPDLSERNKKASGKNSFNYGKSRSEETKRKISETLKKKKYEILKRTP